MEATVVEELVKLVAPGSISDHFELKAIDEKTSSITLYFDEKADRIPESLMGKEAVLDGFMNPVELQTFPLKDKVVYLCVRRRRWKEKGTQGSGHSNHYELYRPGMKTTIEFGDFLKEELGLQPDEYNQLWTGLTHQG